MKRIFTRCSPLIVALLAGMTWSGAATAQPQIDIAAKKQRMPGPIYQVTVANNGPAISGSSKLEFVDLVPQGVTVVSIGAPGAACAYAVLPVVGPDVITCTRLFPGGIPAGTVWTVTFKIQGEGHCPNCIKARLYRRVGASYVLFNEANMSNNVACAH